MNLNLSVRDKGFMGKNFRGNDVYNQGTTADPGIQTRLSGIREEPKSINYIAHLHNILKPLLLSPK